jgi:hypothetical protein
VTVAPNFIERLLVVKRRHLIDLVAPNRFVGPQVDYGSIRCSGFVTGNQHRTQHRQKANDNRTQALTEERMAEEGWVQCSECPLIITFPIAEFMKKLGILECPAGHRCEYEVSLINRGKPPQTVHPMNDAEVAYKELESLLDFLKALVEAKSQLLHEAEAALQGNSGNPDALKAIAQNLRIVRQNILSQLRSQLK